MYNEAKCHLCLQQRTLCNSHIIPEFFYEQMGLYDSKHRLKILSTSPEKHPPCAQKGIRERLLCEECEGKFSQWEGYARQALFGGTWIEINSSDARGIKCTVDYTKFKLFELSVVWRVGISTHQAFSSVSLGEHEDVLRRMLFTETPGNGEAYGCVLIHSSKYEAVTANMIHCMGTTDVDGVVCVRLILGGLFWFFFLSSTCIDPRQTGLFLQENGHLRILRTGERPNQYIEHLAKALFNADPKRFRQFEK